MHAKESGTTLEPCCLATAIGSLPHTDARRGTELILRHTPEIPSWVQLPKRTFNENMMVQFTEGLPGLAQGEERVYFDTAAASFVDEATDFYARYLAVTEEDDPTALDSFGITAEYGAGFGEFIAQMSKGTAPRTAVKGQVTGPFTLGINLLDQDDRSGYYDDQLRDIIVKSIAMKALWQIERLRQFGAPVMIFLDEPALVGFGSQTLITVSREDVIGDLNEVVATVHAQGGLAGVHCEENTDWSLLMDTDLDILDFDAYDHMQAITLYPAELRAFLDRGGWLGWGIVPTLDKNAAANETIPSLLSRFDDGVEQLVRKGFDRDLLLRRALITPSCGAGGVLTEPLAERVLELLQRLSHTLRTRHGFADS